MSSTLACEGRLPLEFLSGNHRYTVLRVLVKHPDHDIQLVASRQYEEGGPVRMVILRHVQAPSREESVRRAQEELRLARYLGHANITSAYDCALHEGEPYVVQEYLPGCFLLTVLSAMSVANRTLSRECAAWIAAEVADALEHAHQRMDKQSHPLLIVHRAVSPIHIRVSLKGRVKLSHLGMAWSTLRERINTPPYLLRGEPAYAAPEVLRAALEAPAQATPTTGVGFDARADIFSLGLVLLEMLLAHHPLDAPHRLYEDTGHLSAGFRAERSSWLRLELLADRLRHFSPEEMIDESHAVPDPLRAILANALRVAPEERYATAGAMGAALRAWLASRPKPFVARKAGTEIAALLEEAADVSRLVALPGVERGVFALPPDSIEGGGV